MPVSIRRASEEHELGNRISTILVKLPVGEPDPLAGLEGLRDETAWSGAEHARAASLIVEAAGLTPPTIDRVLSSRWPGRSSSTSSVNVPGPQQPLYMLGRRLREIYPYVPLPAGPRAVARADSGRVFFGIVGDRNAMPDLDDFAAAIDRALAEQLAPLVPQAR